MPGNLYIESNHINPLFDLRKTNAKFQIFGASIQDSTIDKLSEEKHFRRLNHVVNEVQVALQDVGEFLEHLTNEVVESQALLPAFVTTMAEKLQAAADLGLKVDQHAANEASSRSSFPGTSSSLRALQRVKEEQERSLHRLQDLDNERKSRQSLVELTMFLGQVDRTALHLAETTAKLRRETERIRQEALIVQRQMEELQDQADKLYDLDDGSHPQETGRSAPFTPGLPSTTPCYHGESGTPYSSPLPLTPLHPPSQQRTPPGDPILNHSSLTNPSSAHRKKRTTKKVRQERSDSQADGYSKGAESPPQGKSRSNTSVKENGDVTEDAANGAEDGESDEEKRRRDAEERLRMEEEMLRREEEEERRLSDPANWTVHEYLCGGINDYTPGGVGCYVRARPDRFQQSTLRCEALDPRQTDFPLATGHLQVSNCLHLQTKSGEDLSIQPALRLYVPLCEVREVARRMSSVSHTALKVRQGQKGAWCEVDAVRSMIKDTPCLETQFTCLSRDLYMVAVRRPLVETLRPGRTGGAMTSHSDPRVKVRVPRKALGKDASISLEVTPVTTTTFADIQRTHRDFSHVQGASPLVQVTITTGELKEPVELQLPYSPSLDKITPRSPHSGEGSALYVIQELPSGERTTFQPESASNLKVALREAGGPIKVVALRVDARLTLDDVLQHALTLTHALHEYPVIFLLRQRSHDPSRVYMDLCHDGREEALLQRLTEDGYDSGPQPSKVLLVRDGDCLEVTFTGNIEFEGTTHAQIEFRAGLATSRGEYVVRVRDPYAQWGRDQYVGTAILRRKSRDQTEANRNDGTENAMRFMCELPVQLPKDHGGNKYNFIPRDRPKKEPKPIVDGPLTHSLLSELANQIMSAETEILGRELGLGAVRMRRILGNSSEPTEDVIYNLLATWYQTSPKAKDKMAALRQALENIGRGDLVVLLNDI